MAQAKADRQAAGKKAAATRQREQTRKRSKTAGKKAASTRQRNEATDNLQQAQRAASSAISGLKGAVRLTGDAAVAAGKSVASRAGALSGQRRD